MVSYRVPSMLAQNNNTVLRTDKNKIYGTSDPTRLNGNNYLKCKT